MTSRYFVNPPVVTEAVKLEGAEAHHLIHVMKCQSGQSVTVFDGTGCEFAATIIRVGRGECELKVDEKRTVDRELSPPVILAAAFPKGERQRWLVEKSVELGVTRLVPLVTSRCVVRFQASTLKRLNRAIIEASKQCGRNRLMELGSAVAWPEFVSSCPHDRKLIAHGGTEPRELPTAFARSNSNTPLVLAVGPEGGFTKEELAMAEQAGWQQISLGKRTLRIETAALALVAATTIPN